MMKIREINGGKIVDSNGVSHTIKEIKLGTHRVWYLPSILPATNTYQASGDTCTFTVDACCDWSVTEYPDWITLSRSSGTYGSYSVAATASLNTTGASRSGRILIAYVHNNQIFASAQVSQSAAGTISISPIAISNIDADGEVVSVAITTNASWEVLSQTMFWATPSKRYGSQSETITITVSANTTGSVRSGSITFANDAATATLQLSQAASVVPSTFDVQPRSESVGYLAQLIILTVTADASWTASTSASWITLPSAGGAAGTSRFTIECAENTNTRQRFGTIIFRCGVTSIAVTITQAGRSL